MNALRFILFAHPRSGSTNLANLLNLHPYLSILVEPFHENFHLWSPNNPNYLEQVVDAESLDSRPACTVKKLTYEALYEADPLQKETFKKLFDFLGVEHFRSDEMSGLWDKGRNQMNTETTYRSVQNHREIEETGSHLGYGSLFR